MTEQPTRDLRRVQLANGVTLLVQARRVAPAIALVAHVRAGFLDEPDDVAGISHVLEHMLFKGTPSLGPGELARRTKALGGSLNAYTSYDRTVYYASGPARQMREFIALQADQVRNATIDAGELARELGVIIQEARRKLDSPGAVAGETLHELLFATHRLRRWRIGVEATLERFTRDDVAGYYHSRYVPERAIITLVGDVDPDAAIGELRSHWQDWSAAAAVIPAGPAETTPPGPQTRTLRGDVAIAELVLGWRAPGILDREIPALDVTAAILGLGRGSRLARTLRETGLVNAIGVSNYGVVDAGVFAVGAELDAARLEPAIVQIGAAIRDLAASAPATAEFDRAIALLRSRLGRHLERFESRALALAEAEALGDVTRLDREEAELLAVTPADVQAVAAKWLDPADCSAVGYLPEGERRVLDVEMVGKALSDA